MTLVDIAAVAGVHPAHLAKVFRRHHGCSVGAYQRELRLEWTARERAHGDQPLATLAAPAGFADPSHFARRFRLAYGLSPREWQRESARRPGEPRSGQ